MLWLHLIQYAGFFSAQISNSLLVYLIITRAGKLFGSYRHVMTVFAVYSLLYTWIEVATHPKRLDSSNVCQGRFPEYRVGDSAAVEYHGTVNKKTGIKDKEKSMNLDGAVAKESSDAVLMVGDEEF